MSGSDALVIPILLVPARLGCDEAVDEWFLK